MTLIVLAIALVALWFVGGIYLRHIGLGPQMTLVWQEMVGYANSARAFAVVLYHDKILRAARMTKYVTVVLLLLFAAATFFTGVELIYAFGALGLAALLSVFVLFVEREKHVERGEATGIVDHTDITFAGAYDHTPIIRVDPLDPRTQFEIENVRATGFTIRHHPVNPGDTADFSWRTAERPEGLPLLSIFMTAVMVFAVMASALLSVGLWQHNRAVISISVAYAAVAFLLLAAVVNFCVWIARKSASVVEFLPNLGFQLFIMAATRDFSRVEDVVRNITNSNLQVANAFTQEQWDVARAQLLEGMLAFLVSTYCFAILWPSPAVFIGLKLVELVSFTCLTLLKLFANSLQRQVSAGETERAEMLRTVRHLHARMRLSGLRLYIAVCGASVMLVLYAFLVKQGQARVDTFLNDTLAAINFVLDGVHNGFTWIAKTSAGSFFPALLGAVFCGALAAWLWHKGRAYKALAVLPAILGVIALFSCLPSLVGGAIALKADVKAAAAAPVVATVATPSVPPAIVVTPPATTTPPAATTAVPAANAAPAKNNLSANAASPKKAKAASQADDDDDSTANTANASASVVTTKNTALIALCQRHSDLPACKQLL